ncbi:MAG: hypothetical protein EOO65_00730 [Methanosarcinales archaeon]|nr:MAG: hypothetical protein EOO65_00730 [Methanosarcinales archaeon]
MVVTRAYRRARRNSRCIVLPVLLLPPTMYGKFAAYAGVSLILAGVVVNHAAATRPSAFAFIAYLSENKVAAVVLANMMLVIALAAVLTLKSIFLGALKTTEIEVRACPCTWLGVQCRAVDVLCCVSALLARLRLAPWTHACSA